MRVCVYCSACAFVGLLTDRGSFSPLALSLQSYRVTLAFYLSTPTLEPHSFPSTRKIVATLPTKTSRCGSRISFPQCKPAKIIDFPSRTKGVRQFAERYLKHTCCEGKRRRVFHLLSSSLRVLIKVVLYRGCRGIFKKIIYNPNKFSKAKMKIGLLKNFLHYFNLRQGTILIAIFQLFSSGFSMIFFILALAHAMGIQEMVVRDTEDALEREALEEISSNHLNTKKMDLAHHNATEMIYAMYCGLVITVIHFISTMLLLYGALTNNRHFMAPWMMVKITIISALAISLFLVEEDCPFLATLGGRAGICERLIAFFLIIMSFYVWFVVYSTYKSLEIKKGLTHEVHSMKKKYAVPVPLEVPKAIQISANKPYEL